VVFFQGAIAGGTAQVEETNADIEGTSKMEYPFYEGETLGSAVRANAGRFTVSSDLTNAYVIRGDTQIPMDLNRYLYHNDFSHDFALANGDVILIPFRQFFVLVTGAVKTPGRYPYVPDRQAEYYISLAGGRDELKNNGRRERITDMNGKRINKEAVLIEPETMISVPANRFTVHFNQYAPVITTVLSICATVLTIYAVTR
jgi:protein involved in polysaccharide export with SLBB domain